MLRTLHKQLNHRLSAEKGLLPKGLHSTKSREYQIGRAGLHDHTQKAQAEGGTVGRFNYLSKKEADILAIQKVVCSALDDTVFDEDACDNVISGSKALVDSYRNNKAALRQAMVKAFAEEKFKPDLAKYAIDSIGTAGKSIEAEALKKKTLPPNTRSCKGANSYFGPRRLLHVARPGSHKIEE